MAKNISIKFKNTFSSILKSRSIYRTKPFVIWATWWPLAIIILFGSYFYSGERKPLGDLAWVWQSSRVAMIFLAVICLVHPMKSAPREWLGHSIALYAFFASVTYWHTSPVHDKLFTGEFIRLIASASCFYALTILSFTIVDSHKTQKKLESLGIELDK